MKENRSISTLLPSSTGLGLAQDDDDSLVNPMPVDVEEEAITQDALVQDLAYLEGTSATLTTHEDEDANRVSGTVGGPPLEDLFRQVHEEQTPTTQEEIAAVAEEERGDARAAVQMKRRAEHLWSSMLVAFFSTLGLILALIGHLESSPPHEDASSRKFQSTKKDDAMPVMSQSPSGTLEESSSPMEFATEEPATGATATPLSVSEEVVPDKEIDTLEEATLEEDSSDEWIDADVEEEAIAEQADDEDDDGWTVLEA